MDGRDQTLNECEATVPFALEGGGLVKVTEASTPLRAFTPVNVATRWRESASVHESLSSL